MPRSLPLAGALLCASLVCLSAGVEADCLHDFNDYGDAPECTPAYPSGVIAHFPTYPPSCGTGTQEVSPNCVPRSSPPGEPGYVTHINNYDAWQLWLGCLPDGDLSTIGGADNDIGRPMDCVETAFGGMTFDQDECFGDGVDAGLLSEPVFLAGMPATITFSLVHCVSDHVYLNLLIDMNADGDWNDSFADPSDPSQCIYEWAIKNYELQLGTDLCNTIVSPEFMVGPWPGPAWMRLTVSANPAADSYPWNGASLFAGSPVPYFYGGETEDYPVMITAPTPVGARSWGELKTMYR
jgi:hypothetical protein